MARENGAHAKPVDPPIDPPVSTDRRHPFLRRLSCQNPFYIISAGCTVHGIGLWYHGGHSGNPWGLMGLIGSYILMMALAAFGVVRFGKVWDDARSIFVVILLLFVELTLSFDGTLLRDPPTGRLLLIVGLILALFVTESLLFGLRIRFRTRYRIPFYLMMGQLFLYPLFLLPVVKSGNTDALAWRLFLFSPIAGLTILSLLPAIRGGSAYIQNNGTPWKWPLYPWTVFVTLIACLGIRAYAVCAAFDPVVSQTLAQAMRLETSFNGYFLLPIMIAIAMLLLEAGLVSNRKDVSVLAMLTAVAGIGLSAMRPHSIPQFQFLAEYTRLIGSPLYVAVCAATVFCVYAFIRRAHFAERTMNGAFALHLIIGSSTSDYATRLIEPPVWPLLVLAGLHIGLGCWRHQPRRLVAGLLGAVATLHVTVLSEYPLAYRNVATVHMSWMVILVAGIVFKDEFLRFAAAAGMVLLAGATLNAGPHIHGLDPWLPIGYVIGLSIVAAAFATCLGNWPFGIASAVNGLLASAQVTKWFLHWLRQQPDWKGIAFYLVGLGWFVLAVLVSVLKARRIRRVAVPPSEPQF